MPIYEYRCSLCHKTCDLIQKFSDEPATECPHCHQAGLIRQISAPSFHLKGTGWYVTDFKNGNKSTVNKDSTTDQASEKKEDISQSKSNQEDQKSSTTNSQTESTKNKAENLSS